MMMNVSSIDQKLCRVNVVEGGVLIGGRTLVDSRPQMRAVGKDSYDYYGTVGSMGSALQRTIKW
jgi:hypothetical protein